MNSIWPKLHGHTAGRSSNITNDHKGLRWLDPKTAQVCKSWLITKHSILEVWQWASWIWLSSQGAAFTPQETWRMWGFMKDFNKEHLRIISKNELRSHLHSVILVYINESPLTHNNEYIVLCVHFIVPFRSIQIYISCWNIFEHNDLQLLINI